MTDSADARRARGPLSPVPFPLLVSRCLAERTRSGRIFDLPERSFHKGDPSLDLGVMFQGRPAGTPLGPASGPHGQMAQNLVLGWLAGSRVIELKTVQLQDRLEIPRPCIHVPNVGYNVEGSQELRIEESLREYVAGSMLIEILQAEGVLDGVRPPLQLDLSLGYDLEGIKSRAIRRFTERMIDAHSIVEELRDEIPPEHARLRNLHFRTNLCRNVTLSTFHGCPPEEIESIARFLLVEMGLDVCIKLNPTMLGREAVEGILHDRLGYTEIEPNPTAFERDASFSTVEEMVRRLLPVAASHGRRLAVKMCNTLETINREGKLPGRVVYLSGQPLHVIALHMVKAWREAFGAEVPISFSAGADAVNFAGLVGIGLAPVTTCTDLLRPGGYGRLPAYLAKLEERMRAASVRNIPDYVITFGGRGKEAIAQAFDELRESAWKSRSGWPPWALAEAAAIADESQRVLTAALGTPPVDVGTVLANEVADARERLAAWAVAPAIGAWLEAFARLRQRAADLAAVMNTAGVVRAATEDPRYAHERNHAAPRRAERWLETFDCLSCEKCVGVCPNDAMFSYPAAAVESACSTLVVTNSHTVPHEPRYFRAERERQYAIFADLCNDCGNCDTHCPEHGGPNHAKPRVHGSREAWEAARPRDGFHVAKGDAAWEMLGRIEGKEYRLVVPSDGRPAGFGDALVRCRMRNGDGVPVDVEVSPEAPQGHSLDLEAYCTMRHLLAGLIDPAQVHFVNAGWLSETRG